MHGDAVLYQSILGTATSPPGLQYAWLGTIVLRTCFGVHTKIHPNLRWIMSSTVGPTAEAEKY